MSENAVFKSLQGVPSFKKGITKTKDVTSKWVRQQYMRYRVQSMLTEMIRKSGYSGALTSETYDELYSAGYVCLGNQHMDIRNARNFAVSKAVEELNQLEDCLFLREVITWFIMSKRTTFTEFDVQQVWQDRNHEHMITEILKCIPSKSKTDRTIHYLRLNTQVAIYFVDYRFMVIVNSGSDNRMQELNLYLGIYDLGGMIQNIINPEYTVDLSQEAGFRPFNYVRLRKRQVTSMRTIDRKLLLWKESDGIRGFNWFVRSPHTPIRKELYTFELDMTVPKQTIYEIPSNQEWCDITKTYLQRNLAPGEPA